MIRDQPPPAAAEEGRDASGARPASSIDDLRRILLHDQLEQMDRLESDVSRLTHQFRDEATWIKMIAPVLGEAIRLKIREARDELIDALYPIIGQLIQRAVSQAMADLARSLDAQAKRAVDLRVLWWRLRATFGGASEAQIRLRELLPFEVTDVLLIHKESGLLIFHLSGESTATSDHDLVSGMLTAIGDFAGDTLGKGEQAGLGQIEYGSQRILIESSQYADLAVIVDGTEPPGFRAEMRDRIMEVERSHVDQLRAYAGDPAPLAPAQDVLQPLLLSHQPEPMSRGQKQFLIGASGAAAIVLVGCGLFASMLWPRPSAPVAPPPIPATATVTPTPTPPATATPTLRPTAQPTPTLVPVMGVVLGNVWVHHEPTLQGPNMGVTLLEGEAVEILAQYGDWYWVRRVSAGQSEVIGWVLANWVGTTGTVPAQLITPTPSP